MVMGAIFPSCYRRGSGGQWGVCCLGGFRLPGDKGRWPRCVCVCAWPWLDLAWLTDFPVYLSIYLYALCWRREWCLGRQTAFVDFSLRWGGWRRGGRSFPPQTFGRGIASEDYGGVRACAGCVRVPLSLSPSLFGNERRRLTGRRRLALA